MKTEAMLHLESAEQNLKAFLDGEVVIDYGDKYDPNVYGGTEGFRVSILVSWLWSESPEKGLLREIVHIVLCSENGFKLIHNPLKLNNLSPSL